MRSEPIRPDMRMRMRMSGRMGSDRITTQNLSVPKVDAENGLLLIRCDPGPQGWPRDVKTAVKVVLRHDRDRNQADPRRQAAGGKTNGTVDLPSEIFDATANIALMHQVVVAQLAAARQGTHSTKTRGEVRGGGKKPYARRAPAAHVRARPVRRSSPAVAPSTARSRATTRSAPPRR